MGSRHIEKELARGGYALLAVTVIALVVTMSALAFFTMSSYETKAALYRQESTEAFYLADGAIERARAKFLEDHSWREGWTAISCGDGDYDLAINDTTYLGHSNAVQILAEGRVRQATRRIEVMGQVEPSAFGLTLLILENADVTGNLCLDENIHVGGVADFGPHDVHLACSTSYTEGFQITPPPIYTDPAHFPNATYYYVRGTRINGVYQARIFNASGVDITTILGDSLTDVITYDHGSRTFKYGFDEDIYLNKYFDNVAGVFRRNAGDIGVVVNFGEPPLIDPPGISGVSSLEFQGAMSTKVHATIINTRFTGIQESERVDNSFWVGGDTTVKQVEIEPHYGIAAIAYNFQKQGGSLVHVGTQSWPALVYVTNDVTHVNSNFILEGSIICLGDWNSNGGPDLNYNAAFQDNLPQYLQDNWMGGVSGTLEILRWREIASAGS